MSDTDLATLLERGLAQQCAGQHKAAIQIFRQVLKRGGAAASVLCRLGDSYERLGDFERADAAYVEAIEREPDRSEAYLRAADLARRASAMAERAGQNPVALELRHGAFRYLVVLGVRLVARGAWADAEAAFRNAGALMPEDSAVSVDLGRAIAEQGRLDEGEALIRRGIALGPDQALPHVHLGRVLTRQGRTAAAAAAFQRALALDPGLAAATAGLAALGGTADGGDPAGQDDALPEPE
jgi:tetratricopeptide (TPR) repeat protein